MADRASASVFGKIFNLLAKEPTDDHKAIAKEIYQETGNFDFSDYQMYADEALIALGLAKIGIDPQYPEDGEVVIYGEVEELTNKG